jgi:putative ABC transport system ATP-binding protein
VRALDCIKVSKQVNSPAGPLTIVNEVSVTLDAGESLAIVGPSGSGKSTLLALLAGLDQPTSGMVRLLGDDLSPLDEDGRAQARKGRVGFVFQSFHLLPNLTALENVMLPLELSRQAQARERALAALIDVGLADRARHLPRQLSGGEQQRVAIARAFVSHPEILFADEPTGNLDGINGARVADLLFRLNAASHTTLVLVTHERELAARCGRRLELESGRVVADVVT